MRTSLGQMDGNEWEQYCQRLLRLRYQDYQEVPAQFGGDLGIEGFTRSGLVFQCYSPDEDPSGNDLYEAQRDKITRDISKLIKNVADITGLGAGTIKEWHFLTPRYNSRRLLDHCRSKEGEVLALNLPSIHPDFTIALKIEDDYIPERQIFQASSGHTIQPSSLAPPNKDSLEALLESDNEIVYNIKTKLGKLPVPPQVRASLTRELVSGYVVGQDELQFLNEKFPSTYRSVVGLKAAVESQLTLRVLSSSEPHGTILGKVLDDYANKLTKDFSGSLSTALILRLSTEALSDWMGRCPLDFPNREGCQ